MSHSGRVIKAHKRTYDDPMQVKQGEVIRVTKRELWDDRYPWLWCVTATGKEGWMPESFVEINDEQAIALRDYSAIELTVAIGDNLTIMDEVSGWYWVQSAHHEYGWVPVECVAADLM
jgi:hypothetical protein